MKEAAEPTSVLKQSHLPGIMKHAEELRAEIINDSKPLSRIVLVTNDEDLLQVLGPSGIRTGPAEDASNQTEELSVG